MKKRKTYQKVLAMTLASALILTLAGASLAAEDENAGDTSSETTAVQTSSGFGNVYAEYTEDEIYSIGKDETVWVIAGADGAVEQIIVSDWLQNSDAADEIEDTTTLSDIENVKGYETWTEDEDGTLTWDADGSDICYQGTSDEALPVTMTVTYMLDGEEVSPEELSGGSGTLTIRFDYENNQAETVIVDGEETTVYVPFVVLTGMYLACDNAENVQVTNGYVQCDGSRYLIVGCALPGLQESLDLDPEDFEIPDYVEITADVTEFEVNETLTICMNPDLSELSLDDIDELSDLADELTDLTDASSELVSGAAELEDGLSELNEKTGELTAGIDAVSSGADSVNEGASDLSDGADSLYAGLATLWSSTGTLISGVSELQTGAGSLTDGAADLAAGMETLYAGLQSLYEQSDTLISGVSELQTGAETLSSGAADMASGAAALETGVTSIADGLTTLSGNSETLNVGAEQILTATVASVQAQLTAAGLTLPEELTTENYGTILTAVAAALPEESAAVVTAAMDQIDSVAAFCLGLQTYTSGVDQLAAASETAASGAESLTEGATEVSEGAASLASGVDSLAEGGGTLVSGVSQLYEGAETLNTGAESLASGAAALEAGVDELAESAPDLSDGVEELKDGAATLASGAESLESGTVSLAEGAAELADGGEELTDGVQELTDGGTALADGMAEFDEEGVQKLADLLGDGLEDIIARLSALQDVSEDYDSFSGTSDDMEGTVRFIYKTASVE